MLGAVVCIIYYICSPVNWLVMNMSKRNSFFILFSPISLPYFFFHTDDGLNARCKYNAQCVCAQYKLITRNDHHKLHTLNSTIIMKETQTQHKSFSSWLLLPRHTINTYLSIIVLLGSGMGRESIKNMFFFSYILHSPWSFHHCVEQM